MIDFDLRERFVAAAASRHKRVADAAAWGVAIASPGMLGALSQVDKIVRASSYPSVTPYLFGSMECVFLASMCLGAILYHRVNSILTAIDYYAQLSAMADAYRTKASSELEKNADKDYEAFGRYFDYGQTMSQTADEFRSMIDQSVRSRLEDRLAVGQRRLIVLGYVLLMVIVLTSSFRRLAAG